jgi:alkanesulfonate monooxygenase SsuD/methylene tetrahydromethanopterin reductase-like flavin-dependent oxidoreductase (luciferase family)
MRVEFRNLSPQRVDCPAVAADKMSIVQVDLLLDPFGANWSDVREAAIAAEGEGFDGVWLYDHLAGSVHGQGWVLECWTTLTAIAAVVPRITVGTMVLNVANRDPGTLGVMAATLQEISGGRLMLGLGAGGGRDTPYAAEQFALGRSVPGDTRRRAAVESAIAAVRSVWSGTVRGTAGFLRPDPPPPVIVGGFGPRMAELAGRVADGINLPGGPQLPALLEVARTSRASIGADPSSFIVSVSSDLSASSMQRLSTVGVDRAVAYVPAPSRDYIRRLAKAVDLRD